MLLLAQYNTVIWSENSQCLVWFDVPIPSLNIILLELQTLAILVV